MTLFDKDNWIEITHTLKQNKLRSFLTAFGIFWGIFLLIVMLGAGKGLENGAMEDFSRYATNSVFIWARQTTIPYKGFPRGRRFSLNNEDTVAIRKNIPEIAYLAPRNQLGGFRGISNVIRQLKNGAFNIYGDYPEFIHIKNMDIITGRFINNLDINQDRKVAVIGERVLEVLFNLDEDPIGEFIQIKGVFFKVIGVFKTDSDAENAEEETQTIFVPFTTFQKTFNFGDRVSWYSITSKEGTPASIVQKKVISLLARRHQVSPDDTFAFGAENIEKDYLRIVNLFIGIKALLWSVGICTLLAGVIGVSNIMLIIVKERTKEIGIKRAIGATPLNILSQIMWESLLLTFSAGYMGLFAGVGFVELISHIMVVSGSNIDYFENPEIKLSIAVTALLILVASGVLSGLIPGHKAVKIKPVEAIRDT
jgi:putative ABC transport system permease protein